MTKNLKVTVIDAKARVRCEEPNNARGVLWNTCQFYQNVTDLCFIAQGDFQEWVTDQSGALWIVYHEPLFTSSNLITQKTSTSADVCPVMHIDSPQIRVGGDLSDSSAGWQCVKSLEYGLKMTNDEMHLE